MMKEIFSVVILTLFIGCSNTKLDGYNEDFEFKSNFENCLLVICYKQIGIPIPDIEVGKAYECLEKITNIENLVLKYSDSPYHYLDTSYTELKTDLVNWSEWFEDNKCIYGMKEAKNKFGSEDVLFPDYNDSSTINSLRNIYSKSDFSIEQDSLLRVSVSSGWPKSNHVLIGPPMEVLVLKYFSHQM